MKVIIPIAGCGTRLRPLTYGIPKPLLPCAGNTVLGWIFKSISFLSASEIIMVIGYKGNEIREWVERLYPKLLIRWVVQKEARGLGHAIWTGGKEISLDEDILIYLGDTIFDADWERIQSGEDNLIAVREVEDPRRFGVVKIEDGKVVDMVEKPTHPPSNLAILGLYYIKKWGSLYPYLNYLVEEDIKTGGEHQLTDGLRLMIEKENITLKVIPVKGWFDCGTKKNLLETNAALLKNYLEDKMNKDWIKSPSYIANSAEIKDSEIGPYVSIGENSVVKDSIVTNSIIGSEVEVSNSRLFNSIIGNRAEIKNAEGSFIIGCNAIISSQRRISEKDNYK